MLKENVINTIKKYNLIESGDTVIVAVSGGPDSICLLHVLNEIKDTLEFKICVAHVNHMIRKEADEETKYVEDFCKNIGIECFTKKIDVLGLSKDLKKGTEETGREVRYEFFNEVAERAAANKVATAHNNNDKVETIIMNILRGSGLSGIKGIDPVRNNKYIRPLIEISRKDIEKYCEENDLKPKYDKSNDENIYTRNKVRNVVIPYIQKEFNPNIFRTLNRLSELVAEEDEYLNKIVENKFMGLTVEQMNKSRKNY